MTPGTLTHFRLNRTRHWTGEVEGGEVGLDLKLSCGFIEAQYYAVVEAMERWSIPHRLFTNDADTKLY